MTTNNPSGKPAVQRAFFAPPQGLWPVSLTDYLTPVSAFQDTWASFPVRLLAYGFAASEAITHSLPKLRTPLALATGSYVLIASGDRAVRAGDLEMHPERIRVARSRHGVDSFLTAWLETITLPSIAVPLLRNAVASAVASAGVSGAAAAHLPAAVALASLPLLLPATSRAAEGLSAWAFRPAIAFMEEKIGAAVAAGYGDGDYVPPPPEELLLAGAGGGGGAGAEGEAGRAAAVMAALGVGGASDLDPLERARIEWALDGDPSSPYPEEEDAAGVAGVAFRTSRSASSASPTATTSGSGSSSSGSSGAGGGSLAAAAAAAAAAKNSGASSSSTNSSSSSGRTGGGGGSGASAAATAAAAGQARYLAAVAHIRERAAARAALAESAGPRRDN